MIRLLAIVGTIFANLAISGLALSEVPVDVLEVEEGLYVFRPDSEIGNQTTMAFVADDEILLVDANIESSLPVILDRLREISRAPIRFIATSHHHGDHTQGLELLPSGVTAIVPEKQRSRLETTSLTFEGSPPLNPDALPGLTFQNGITLRVGDERISIITPPEKKSHTDGDAFVYFETRGVLYVGDHYIYDKLPLIDAAGGGSIDGYLSNLKWILDTYPRTTQIVPGHGSFAPNPVRVAEFDVFEAWVQNVEAAVNVLRAYKNQGHSVEQAIELGLGHEYASMSERPRYISEERWIKMIYPQLED